MIPVFCYVAVRAFFADKWRAWWTDMRCIEGYYWQAPSTVSAVQSGGLCGMLRLTV